MMVVKRWMGDATACQIIALVPAGRISQIMGGLIGLQPTGVAPRRLIAADMRKNIETEVPKLLARRFISGDAAHYLTSYVRGTLDLPPRPLEYPFLRYRWNKGPELAPPPLVQYDGEELYRGVVVKHTTGSTPDKTEVEDAEDTLPLCLLLPKREEHTSRRKS
jgi:hypothetical protein